MPLQNQAVFMFVLSLKINAIPLDRSILPRSNQGNEVTPTSNPLKTSTHNIEKVVQCIMFMGSQV